LRKVYHKSRRSVAYVTVETREGIESIGTAFHIGQGYFVTARHVIENNKIIDVCITQPQSTVEGYHSPPLSDIERPRSLIVASEPVLAPNAIDDVAVFRVEEFEGLPTIPLSSVHDIHQDEDLALLTNVLCIGYPPIPLTVHPFQVAVDATVSAMINIRGSSYLTFVLSATARGGFSGGPILNDNGNAIALVTDSLVRDCNAVETGFMACLSITAVADLALNCGWEPDDNDFDQDIESLANIKLALSSTAKLNPHAHDAQIYVYDDDRDVFFEISCVNEQHRNLAADAFNSVCPIKIRTTEGASLLATPRDNPRPALLKHASQYARDTLLASGYCLVRERFSKGWNWD